MSKPNFQIPTSKNRIQPPLPLLQRENFFNLSESSLDLGKFIEVENGPCSDLPKKDLKVQIGATHLGLSVDQHQQGTFNSCEKIQKQVELMSRSSFDSHVEFVETKCLTDLPKELLNCIRQRTDEVGVTWSKILDDLEFTTTNTTFSGIKKTEKNSASDPPRKMFIAAVASQPKRKWTISNPSNGSVYEEEMMPMNIGKSRRIDEEHCEISKKIKTGVPKDQRSLSKISPVDTPEELDYPSLPIMSPEQFEHLEKILVTKQQFSPRLLKRLKLVDDGGGKNVDRQVKQILKTLFSEKMRQQINWKGRNDKVGFKNTKIQAIVYDAVRSNFPKVTDNELKQSIINFFRRHQQQPNKRGTGKAVKFEEKSFSENSEMPKKFQKSPPTTSNKTKMGAQNNPSKFTGG